MMSDKKAKLKNLRDSIAAIDEQLLRQLEVRAEKSLQIHRLLEGEPVQADPGYRSKLKQLLQQAGQALPKESLARIFEEVFAAARALEEPVKVACMGPEGAFSGLVAKQQFGASVTLLECATVAEALEQVVRGRAAYAVFPFESSVDGLVQSSIRELERTDLVMVAERAMPATYDLVATEESPRIETIFTTASAHAACELFLEREFPEAKVVDVRSPARAVSGTVDNDNSAALIPAPTGRAESLTPLRSNVGDMADMHFRYGVAGNRPAPRSGHDTTCLLLSVDDSPGALYDVLRHLAERRINMKKLQSWPVADQAWHYVFYVEIAGHPSDRPVVTALEAVKRSTKYFRLLGSFPSRVAPPDSV